jgi:dTDP-4-dehydrorhamnose reductase
MWLLIGGDSEIGAATYKALKAQDRPVAATTRRIDRIAADRPFLDLAAPLTDWEPPPATRAACIFAGIARLATCASEPQKSEHVNVTQTAVLVDRLVERSIPVLFLSSNQVFDGSTPNVPADAPLSPVSVYGRQKARTETALHRHLDAGASVGILRLAKVVSPDMPLIRGWIAALAAKHPISAFGDMTVAPTPTALVAAAIGLLLRDGPRGIFQLTGSRDVSYAEIANYLAARIHADPGLVTKTSARGSGLPEGVTPRHTTLDSSLLRRRYGLEPPEVWSLIETLVDQNLECVER